MRTLREASSAADTAAIQQVWRVLLRKSFLEAAAASVHQLITSRTSSAPPRLRVRFLRRQGTAAIRKVFRLRRRFRRFGSPDGELRNSARYACFITAFHFFALFAFFAAKITLRTSRTLREDSSGGLRTPARQPPSISLREDSSLLRGIFLKKLSQGFHHVSTQFATGYRRDSCVAAQGIAEFHAVREVGVGKTLNPNS